ncbi:tRNA 2-thiouridine(34) synthase MnmA [candidate division WWE3 bacterium RIFCSPHIGHO2_01_FULL_40_23]|uniref:tRNA-specific 2-thiouridylase MnmA n=1 Tax=candidate division WWE3 bacterium RIFCSPLOWO2_01_FULL_41_18 TaxID=1802625 RepID=A0A1F4VEP2_UNCKA|nr:MAG: tRNA 2-thiouridine(34) synthase MnmA [candidate division WWE3 bacterium RIFCSPHIGHO2_01_FULL_40_23]OGC55732.1 MAG: tRNA 2-thiouridine(34) synthase MnmA [candidate division WWE3 bacterium RIFCSPLOWO2_01_FULL_41_18]
MKKIKVAVGLSGGVDSSVALLLLKEGGFFVTGVHMRCWDYDAPGCSGNEDKSDAIKVSAMLERPLMDLNFEKEYKERVLKYFFSEIRLGRTPNPDVVCNQEIKFGLFLDWALKNGFDYVATGHYALILGVNVAEYLSGPVHQNPTFTLASGADEAKDQSYFLYRLGQKELKHILFPIGHLTKQEVRIIAKEAGLPTYDKLDSTGICFIGDIDVKDFIKSRVKVKKGKVLDINGDEIGEHEGAELYTIGQRHGFSVSKYTGLPLYVIKKDTKANTITVGFGKDVQRKNFEVSDISWVNKKDKRLNLSSLKCSVRIRNLGEKMPGAISVLGTKTPLSNASSLNVELDDYALSVAPGQSAVFYLEDVVLGGGVIR